MTNSYDALLLVSFGGPEHPDDVIPFLENVLRGRNVPRERMLEVAEHYYHFGGVSPINAQNRELIAALEVELKSHGITLPIYWGNRNWHPLLPDTLRAMGQNGVRRALAFFTSAFSSYSGCRQYRENVAAAQAEVGPTAPLIDKLRACWNHPGFIETMIDRVQVARGELPPESDPLVLFTAHSIPLAMSANCNYVAQLTEASKLIARGAKISAHQLVYQSRSGPPQQPWLEPDVCDALRAAAQENRERPIIIVPLGFISDHMEVMYDLDEEARHVSQELGVTMVRAKTAGTHPRFVSMIRELIVERMTLDTRAVVGDLPACLDVCAVDCCKYEPQRPPAGRPA